jgi:hypothetical protein
MQRPRDVHKMSGPLFINPMNEYDLIHAILDGPSRCDRIESDFQLSVPYDVLQPPGSPQIPRNCPTVCSSSSSMPSARQTLLQLG